MLIKSSKIITCFFVVFILFFTGCSHKSSPNSLVDLEMTNMLTIDDMKRGETCKTFTWYFPLWFLYSYPSSEIDAKKTALSVGISEIKYQENTTTYALPWYYENCTVVYGK